MKLTMENEQLILGNNNHSNNNNNSKNYKYESFVNNNNPSLLESAAKGDDINNNNPSSSLLGESSIIDGDGYIECNIHDDDNDDDDSEVDYEQQQLELQLQHNFHEKYRFLILAIVVITPMGVKFFKASQSSFEEYLMNDPRILMSATTYSLMLSLMSIPVATLIGGVLLDYNHRERRESHNHNEHQPQKNKYINRFFNPGSLSCLGTTRTPSYSAIAFIGISYLGIIIYGWGLEVINNQTIALIGATIFGLGEGCVVVASRTFVAHAFYGSDGAFAQGVLVAMNNLAMVASKIIIPWLIENENDKKSHMIIGGNSSSKGSNHNDISIGIVACCVAMLMSLVAAILYAVWFGGTPRPQRPKQQQQQQRHHHHHHHTQPQEAGEPSREMLEKKEEERPSKSMISSMISNMISSTKSYCQKLPLTFWIVAIGRAIFVVTFKVFSHNSNSILMEKFGVGAVAAGRKSSLHEMFTLLSPLVGYLAYRSPGGIVIWLFGAAVLGTISIATITFLPASTIQEYLPGGALTPMAGISVAHGIFIPICLAIIPLTVPENQLGAAFSVVEAIGSIFSLTNIAFGWLRDTTGDYHAPMELLFVYSFIGTCLVWYTRNHIRLQQPNE